MPELAQELFVPVLFRAVQSTHVDGETKKKARFQSYVVESLVSQSFQLFSKYANSFWDCWKKTLDNLVKIR